MPYPGANTLLPLENSRIEVPYTWACRTESAMLYERDRISVALLNLDCLNIIYDVTIRMMADTTISSIRVNPLEERGECLEKINMQKISAGRPEDKERGKRHLALHCIAL